jgi:uncharacterized protein (DUF2141 family)
MRNLSQKTACIGIASVALSSSVWAGNIEVTVNNLQANKGKLYASLCTNDSFMKGRCDFEIERRVTADAHVLTFSHVDEGEYAVSLFYDVNSNEKLDTSMFGIPKEPTGVSNNVPAANGPPSFEAAKFAVIANSEVKLDISVF